MRSVLLAARNFMVPVNFAAVLLLTGCAGTSGPLVPVDVREVTPAPQHSGYTTVSTSYMENNPTVKAKTWNFGRGNEANTASTSHVQSQVQVAASDEQAVVRPLDASASIEQPGPAQPVPLAAAVPAPVNSPVARIDANPDHQHPAVKGLVDQSERERKAGRLPQAAAALERALRISPNDAGLWHRLAALRLDQGQARQAESFAQKSNALAGNDQQLRDSNAALIQAARG